MLTCEQNVGVELLLDVHVAPVDGVHDHIGHPPVLVFSVLFRQLLGGIYEDVSYLRPVQSYHRLVRELILYSLGCLRPLLCAPY